MQATPPSPEAVDSALRVVLARPEFATPTRSPLSRWIGSAWERLGDWIGRLIAWLFPHLDAAGMLGPTAWRIVLVLLGGVGVLLLWYLGRRGLALWRRRARRRRGGEALEPGAPASSAEWEARSAAAERAGRWREAAIALYFAVVHRLSRAGAIAYDASKTPGDYRREARRVPSLARSVDAFVRAYEPLAFGRRTADASAFGRLKELARGLGANG